MHQKPLPCLRWGLCQVLGGGRWSISQMAKGEELDLPPTPGKLCPTRVSTLKTISSKDLMCFLFNYHFLIEL